MFTSLSDTFTLSNGVKIPCVGFGTYKTPDGDVCVTGVLTALEAGYRHIDTAEFYFNEEGVGKALAETSLPREDIFVTTKVWNTHQGFDATLRAFDLSMQKLGLNTLDLYLVHCRSPRISRKTTPPVSSTRGGLSNAYTRKTRARHRRVQLPENALERAV